MKLHKVAAKLDLLKALLSLNESNRSPLVEHLSLIGFPKIFPTVNSDRAFINMALPVVKNEFDISIDLGSGHDARNPFDCNKALGIDICHSLNENHIQHDIVNKGLPFDDNSIDVVTAHDFLEHVPRIALAHEKTIFPFVELLNEVYRVLKPNGVFYSRTPAYPSVQAFQDPTHINYITEQTLPRYFCSPESISKFSSLSDSNAPLAKMYGFKGEFKHLASAWYGYLLLNLLTK